MDTVLVLVTGLSLALAAAMAVLLARLLREERRRSEARIALLTELAAEPSAPIPQTSAAAAVAIRGPLHRTRPASFEDLDLRPEAYPEATRPELFHDHEESSPWPRRLAVAAGLSVVTIVLALGWRSTPRIDGPATAATEASVSSPLELLALSHVQESGSITIRGRVQNPHSGPALSSVQATALVLGRDGTTISGGRASLEALVLRPGEESAFTIRIPVTEAAARYRVGFRGPDDQALSHIDRRSAEAIARKEAP
jgi:hypothetical protein